MQTKKDGRSKKRRRTRTQKYSLWKRVLSAVISVLAIGLFVVMLTNAPRDAEQPVTPDDVTPEATVAVTEQLEAETMRPTPTPAPTLEPTASLVPSIEASELSRQESVSILISAAGDCTLGGQEGAPGYRNFKKTLEAEGYDYFFANVRSIFTEDDITIVNLEGPLTTSKTKRKGRTFNFKGAPEYVQILSGSSVEVCNLANNHILDYTETGAKETAKVLRDANIGFCGYGLVHYAEIKGLKIAFLGFTQWNDSQAEAEKLVKQIRPECDILIVSFHWGQELNYKVTKKQRNLGRAMVDAGADLVLGHHSHVIGGVEQYKGKYIVYSLGNFCFGGKRNPKDKDTYIFQQRLIVDTEGQVTDGGVRIIPCIITSKSKTNNFQPTPLSGSDAQRVLAKVKKYSSVENYVPLVVEQ